MATATGIPVIGTAEMSIRSASWNGTLVYAEEDSYVFSLPNTEVYLSTADLETIIALGPWVLENIER